MPDFSNLILRALPADELENLRSFLEPVELCRGKVIYRAGEPIKYVYFPETCLISMQTVFMSGVSVESGLIGCEGAVGTCLALSRAASNRQAFVQISGSAYRLATKHFFALAQKDSILNRIILSYAFTYIEQAAQIGACNCVHAVDARLTRVLLLCRDRVTTDKLRLTHDGIAQLLGIHRPSVSIYAKQFKDAGLIDYNRGSIRISDHTQLEERACECYGIIRQSYDEYISHLGGECN